MFDNSITVMKYRNGKRYEFRVMDRFDEPDEVKRLDKMVQEAKNMAETMIDFEQLWIKTCPIFYIPPETKLPKLVR